MNAGIPEEYRDVLERVIVGDLDDDDPLAREMLEKCPPCREQVERLRGLQSTLDGLGAEERDVVGDFARAPAFDPRVESALRAQIDGPRAGRVPRAAAIAVVAVAAALLLLFIRGRGPEPDRRGPSGTTLGGTIELLEPAERVSEFGTFRWRYDLPAGSRFELKIRDASGTVVVDESLTEPQWTPTREQRDRLTPEIHWEVVVSDELTGPVTAAERISRSAP